MGTGGDGSNNAKGNFFEGAITSSNPPDATSDTAIPMDTAVQLYRYGLAIGCGACPARRWVSL
jgi:hypothetical protein